ncbi:MAG: hypothetical protein US50_C0015G0011 [Candidatus Nomurabacteria bacterium GW2011_GWB1_37_5]|uniref:Uncharacterized protein n=1 Tax=Candidatus Nomurabacteria bacterium GW2011_GWB1_37_5 TaxID=1618742 RepID=A0A0G0JF80_9BACT|nr:MAG: hypothetical protein US50_C0015G0011 [Candidatus Nomurabacteria bacterium GW2011_GWB1_37_5]
MYPYNQTSKEISRIQNEIFEKSKLHYEQHTLWNEYIVLLAETNETRGTAISYNCGRTLSNYTADLIFVGQTKEEVEQNFVYTPVEIIYVPSHYFWTKDDYRYLENEVKTFSQMRELALSIISRISDALEKEKMSNKISQVCGPITGGGKGSIKENLKIFSKTIHKLNGENNNFVLDQMPFEPVMHDLAKDWLAQHPSEKYCKPIFDEFYLPIFESGLIKKFFFIHGWQSSKGAQWEHDQAIRLKIEIECLPENFV